MKIIAIMPVRSEAWVLGLSARVALKWVDELIVLNHASTDNTVDICLDLREEFDRRFSYTSEDDGNWDEMRHRQRLLEFARQRGATHIAIIDADELLTGNLLPGIRDTVKQTPRGGILQLPMFNLRDSLERYHASGIWGGRIVSVAFPDVQGFGWHGDQFHAREPKGPAAKLRAWALPVNGGVMHLWGVSERRLKAKHALYKITERLRWPAKSVSWIDGYYSLAIKGQPPTDTPATWKFKDTPGSWWEAHNEQLAYLDLDAEPWQEAEVRRLVAEHGRDKFAGLDLFGVA